MQTAALQLMSLNLRGQGVEKHLSAVLSACSHELNRLSVGGKCMIFCTEASSKMNVLKKRSAASERASSVPPFKIF